MSKVVAKFRVTNLEDAKYATEGGVTVTFYGVQGEPFGPATPSAQCSMVIQNTAAAQVFKDAYQSYVDAARAWQAADVATRGDYPKQPEYYVTFKLDNGTGAE